MTDLVRRTRMLALAFVGTALPSCVGFGVVDSVHSTEDLWDERRGTPLEDTAHDLRERRGDPDDIVYDSESIERWYYHGDLRAAGVVLFVVIPLPLVVPVGWNHDEYVLEDEVVVRIDRVRQRWRASACGVLGHSWGCDTVEHVEQ